MIKLPDKMINYGNYYKVNVIKAHYIINYVLLLIYRKIIKKFYLSLANNLFHNFKIENERKFSVSLYFSDK